MRPKAFSVLSLAASLALVLSAAAPAFGQNTEARAGEDVVASVPTPAAEELPPFANPGQVQPLPNPIGEHPGPISSVLVELHLGRAIHRVLLS